MKKTIITLFIIALGFINSFASIGLSPTSLTIGSVGGSNLILAITSVGNWKVYNFTTGVSARSSSTGPSSGDFYYNVSPNTGPARTLIFRVYEYSSGTYETFYVYQAGACSTVSFPGVNTIIGVNTVCQGQTVTYTTNTVAGASYRWDMFVDGIQTYINGSSLTVTYNTSSSYSFILRRYDACFTDISVQKYVSVKEYPTIDGINIPTTINSSTVSFNFNSVSGITYDFNLSGGSFDTFTNIMSFNTSGNKSLTINATNDICSVSTTIGFNISIPVITIPSTIGGGNTTTTSTIGGNNTTTTSTIVGNNTTSGNNTTITSTIVGSNAITITGIISNVATVGSTVPLFVTISGVGFQSGVMLTINGVSLANVAFVNSTTLVATIPSGIVTTAVLAVVAKNIGTQPSAATPITLEVVTSIPSVNSAPSLHIYPNPTGGEWSLSGGKGQIVSVYNSLGNLIFTQHLASETTKIDTTLPVDIYLVKVGANTLKLLVQP